MRDLEELITSLIYLTDRVKFYDEQVTVEQLESLIRALIKIQDEMEFL
jgi:hypothetical protein